MLKSSKLDLSLDALQVESFSTSAIESDWTASVYYPEPSQLTEHFNSCDAADSVCCV